MIRENLDLLGDCTSSATLSPDGLHRFRLDRAVASKGHCYAFIGVNPSTADATLDDATVRKWRGFVTRWGGAKFVVANLFTHRAKNVKDLATCEEVNRDFHSEHHLDAILRAADVIVPCWGDMKKVPKFHRARAGAVARRLTGFGKPLKCFGYTKDGDPLHPLMLGYDTALVDFWDSTKEGEL